MFLLPNHHKFLWSSRYHQTGTRLLLPSTRMYSVSVRRGTVVLVALRFLLLFSRLIGLRFLLVHSVYGDYRSGLVVLPTCTAVSAATARAVSSVSGSTIAVHVSGKDTAAMGPTMGINRIAEVMTFFKNPASQELSCGGFHWRTRP
ncbi:hypothetical protein BJX70DRAFT_376394 [Aspergillus crustosus]